jgi:hypothetical protein
MLGGPASAKTTTETQTWLAAGARIKLSKKLYMDGIVLQKSNLTLTDIYQFYPKVSLGYRAHKYLRLEGGARYAFEFDEGERDQRLRFFQDLGSSSPELWWFKLGLRLRFQQTHEQNKDQWTPKLRNKLSFSILLSPYFRPGIYYEHFLDLSESRENMSADHRLGLSIGSRITRKHRLKLKFFQNTELNGDFDKEVVFYLGYHVHL